MVKLIQGLLFSLAVGHARKTICGQQLRSLVPGYTDILRFNGIGCRKQNPPHDQILHFPYIALPGHVHKESDKVV